MSDLTSCVFEVTGPILQEICSIFITFKGSDPLKKINWMTIRKCLLDIYIKKCLTLRECSILGKICEECIGNHIISSSSTSKISRFGIPIQSFQSMLNSPAKTQKSTWMHCVHLAIQIVINW